MQIVYEYLNYLIFWNCHHPNVWGGGGGGGGYVKGLKIIIWYIQGVSEI